MVASRSARLPVSAPRKQCRLTRRPNKAGIRNRSPSTYAQELVWERSSAVPLSSGSTSRRYGSAGSRI